MPARPPSAETTRAAIAAQTDRSATLLSSVSLPPAKAAAALLLGVVMTLSNLTLTPETVHVSGGVLAFAIAWAAIVDIDRFILPNLVTLPLIVLGLGLATADGLGGFVDRSIGALVGYGSLALVAYGYRSVRKREGLGQGDAKLFAAAGAWVGWSALPSAMLIACMSALIWIGVLFESRRPGLGNSSVAFGPFIAIGFWIVWLAQDVP